MYIRKWRQGFSPFSDYIYSRYDFVYHVFSILIKKIHLAIFSFGMYFFPYGII